jgi:hypothetical protein
MQRSSGMSKWIKDNVHYMLLAVFIVGWALIIIFISQKVFADNEIHIDQSGATVSIDLEQQGASNLIGGVGSVAGTLTDFDFIGATNTLDINQIGSSNLWKGDITADSYTGMFQFTGDSNVMTVATDTSNTYGADSSNVNVNVTGGSNTLILNQATSAAAGTLDLDWIIQGSNNTITSSINIDQATNYMDIDGSDNTITYTGTGVNASAGGYFWLDHTGGSRTFDVTQASTLTNDWVKITSNGSNGTVCVEQDDQGTAVGC